MNVIIVQQIEESSPTRFTVIRHEPYQAAPGDKVVAAHVGFPVAGTHSADLRDELRWYLEEFLDYPFSPQTERAERVLDALKAWGTQAFKSLFNEGKAREFYHDAIRNGLEELQIRIVSSAPSILAWPWEALHDPEHGFLAHHCHIERQLTNVADPLPLPKDLPTDRVNILLVTARPFEDDVHYRSISRPLVELVHEHHLPAEVTLLRPPTLDQLDRVLAERPGYFHVVHFDGHGGYGPANGEATAAEQLTQANPHAFFGPQGCLVFETADGQPHSVPASTLGALMKKHRIPAVVLNACQSATLDEHAEDAFASVAASLVRAGVRSVVAMAWSLYVSGAQQFLPAFYEQLFRRGNLADSTRAGRAAMLAHPGRVCARGKYPLSDWLVPVVYQQQPVDFYFATKAARSGPALAEPESTPLPEEAKLAQLPFGFIGRDSAILAMERALHRRPPVILIHGLGGVGKTTLAAGFVHWLQQTGGLGRGCFWFTFRDIRSAEHVLNQIGIPLFGPEFATRPNEQKVKNLARAMCEQRFLLVWDNFESVHGNKDADIAPLMPAGDRQLLADLLVGLTGGQTKVLLTSRSEEPWLATERRCRVELGGLHGEERWGFCRAIMEGLGLPMDRQNAGLVELMDLLGGHPLLMRAVLPYLEKQPVEAIAQAIRGHQLELGSATEATLRFVEEGLPLELRSLLVPLALHERFVDANLLDAMARRIEDAGDKPTRVQINRFLSALATAGLIQERWQAIYELHPALTGYLHGTVLKQVAVKEPDTVDYWTRAFVEMMEVMAYNLAQKQLHEQRVWFYLHQANVHEALTQARRLKMDQAVLALTQLLASYAVRTREFDAAEHLYAQLLEHAESCGDAKFEIVACHQLGTVSQERRDFDQAKQWFLRALAIEEKEGDTQGAARTSHEMGIVAQAYRDLDGAEAWFLKALAMKKKVGDKRSTASSYYHLGGVAIERGDFTQAEKWYFKALNTFKAKDNIFGAANTYHQLGIIAQKRGDLKQAEQYYQKALTLFEKLGYEHGAASTFQQLGWVAQECGDLAQAERWYLQVLAIREKEGDEHSAAITYYHMGRVAEDRGDFKQAKQWYLKTLAIVAKRGDEHAIDNIYLHMGRVAMMLEEYDEAERCHLKVLAIYEKQDNKRVMAITYHQLGVIAQIRRDFAQAEQWCRKALTIDEEHGDDHGAATLYRQLGILAQECGDYLQAKKCYLMALERLEKLDNEHEAALTYHQLGLVTQELGDFSQAEPWYRKALAIFEKEGDEHCSALTYGQLGILAGLQEQFEQAKLLLIQSNKGFRNCRNNEGMARTAQNFATFCLCAPADQAARMRGMWEQAGFGPLPEVSESNNKPKE